MFSLPAICPVPEARLLSGLLLALFSITACAAQQLPYAGSDKQNRVAVATVNPHATQIALEAVASGGNAIDAAVAAALALGVVDGHNSGIGGGCFALVRWADGTIEAIDGREMAPAAAHRDMFLRDGKADGSLSAHGPLASGIPGSLAAYDYMLNKGGKRELAELIAPSADLAEHGFAADKNFVRRIGRVAKRLPDYPELAALLLNEAGKPIEPGHLVRQPDLANTYRQIGEKGIAHFYTGEFAKTVAQWMRQNGGIIEASDFANYRLAFREPVRSTYRGYEIVGFPPPSSGGIHVAQILNIVENFKLAEVAPVERRHLLAEAMKLAFADRAYWLGDPDFVSVPRGLISKDYARELAAKIDPRKTTTVTGQGTPKDSLSDIFGKHTTHIAAADKEGNWVAITSTVNTSFGSKVIIPGTGVIMNNQMDDFSIQKDVPNAFNLVGQDANSVQPGKRPLSSMSPTIVLQDGKSVMTLGAAGGPTIINQVVQALVNVIDLDMSLPDAVAEPRVHHQWRPDRLMMEATIPEQQREKLAEMGHDFWISGFAGSTQAIGLDQSGNFVSVAEPRIIKANR